MNPRWRTVFIATATALLALLAAVLLTWSPPGFAAAPEAQRAAVSGTSTSTSTDATTAAPDPASAERAQALQRAQDAVIGLQVRALDDARSNSTLGQARQGSGVVIGADGLVLTIGYLVIEADQVLLQLDDRRSVPARVLGVDVATGFGLVQALAPLHLEPAPLGQSAALRDGEPLMVVSGGDEGAASLSELVARRSYSGYWEYHLDAALFTAPPRRDHSGAALFNGHGELVGIGSLFMADVTGPDEPTRRPGNMFVPVDGLPAILAELRGGGSTRASRRAWLGLNCIERPDGVQVLRVNDDSPAELAGLQPGDRILRIDGTRVTALEVLWKTLWAGGAAEREVVLDIQRGEARSTLHLHSVDRMKTLRRPQGI